MAALATLVTAIIIGWNALLLYQAFGGKFLTGRERPV